MNFAVCLISETGPVAHYSKNRKSAESCDLRSFHIVYKSEKEVDFLLDTTLLNVSMPSIQLHEKNALILSGCRVVLPESTVYSEFDELNFYPLNNNDYACGRADVELNFDNGFQNPYFRFFIQCVTIRTDSEVLCKINRNPMTKEFNHSKVTKEGKVALGVGYYFRNEEEKNLLWGCNSFCIEGFIALKKTNVYGFMCRIVRNDTGWQIVEGNTYRIYKHINISRLYH